MPIRHKNSHYILSYILYIKFEKISTVFAKKLVQNLKNILSIFVNACFSKEKFAKSYIFYLNKKSSKTNVLLLFVFNCNYCLFVIFFVINNTTNSITMPAGINTYALCTNAAITYVTNETSATIIAYGN